MPRIMCKICDAGELAKRSVYRFSGIVVFIGWIILAPSLLSAALGFVMIFSGADPSLDPSAASVGVGIGVFWIFASVCSGLFGWILTMRKSVLQCGTCAATIAAG